MFAFDGVLLIVDLDRVDDEAIAELVASAAQDMGSIYRAADSKTQIGGKRYQVRHQPAGDAGFEPGDRAGTHTAPGVMVVTVGEVLQARSASRLAGDLVEQRRTLVGT